MSAHSSSSPPPRCTDEDGCSTDVVRMHENPYYLEDPDRCAARKSNVEPGCEHGYISMWKLPPEETYSDWTVVVEIPSQEGKTERVYNVHRGMLSSGEVKSEYFAAQFRSEMQESHNRKTKVKLTVEEANAFEYMLDFLYLDGRVPATDDSRHCDVQILPVLHHLGDYFGVHKLCEHALEQCRLSRTTMSLKVDEKAAETKSLALAGLNRLTLLYDEAPMKRASAHLMAHALGGVYYNIPYIKSVCSGITDAAYFALILHLHRNLNSSSASLRLTFVRIWLLNHVGEFEADTFRILTSNDLVGKIPQGWTVVVGDLVSVEQSSGEAQDDHEELTNVQQLAADFIKAYWNTFTIDERRELMGWLSVYSSTVVVKMLGHTLTQN